MQDNLSSFLQTNKARRYPGTQPFSSAEKDIFFGRQDAVRQLYDLVQLENVVVLYGKSGMGKSSVINAGLLPNVLEAGQLEPITIRFGAWGGEPSSTPVDSMLKQIGRMEGKKKNPSIWDKLESANGDSIWLRLKSRNASGTSLKTSTGGAQGYLLVFDQFEELFTYPQALVEQFGQEIVQLLFARVPIQYRLTVDQLEPDYSKSEFETFHHPVNVKLLLAIRSDRMSLLNRLKDYLPNILRHCYELTPISSENAEASILAPAYKRDDRYITRPFDYSDEALGKLLGFLTQEGQQPVELFQLQILCQTIEDKVIRKQTANPNEAVVVQANDLENPQWVYENYYDNQLALIPNPEDQLAARIFIEEGLIFEEDQVRLSLYEGVIHSQYGISTELLAKLVNSRLIRSEPGLNGGYTYELSHDTLVVPVLKAKSKRMQAIRQAQEELLAQEREAELIRERRKRRNVTIIAVLGLLLAVVATGASVFAISASNASKRSEEKARQAETVSEQRRVAAEEALFKYHHAEAQNLIETAKAYRDAGFYKEALEALNAARTIDTSEVTRKKTLELENEMK